MCFLAVINNNLQSLFHGHLGVQSFQRRECAQRLEEGSGLTRIVKTITVKQMDSVMLVTSLGI